MDEERLKLILDIEDQAQRLYDQAVTETGLLPRQAEEQVKLLIENMYKQAEAEAKDKIDALCDPQIVKDVLAKNMQKMQRREALATANMPKAVNYILQNLLGKSNK